ncbi:hypothetical protein ROS1_32620 [Roseibium sp. ROS1]
MRFSRLTGCSKKDASGPCKVLHGDGIRHADSEAGTPCGEPAGPDNRQPEIAPNHLSARPEPVAGNDGDGTR